VHAKRREIVILPLFAVRNNRRARGFKPLNGLWNRICLANFACENCLERVLGRAGLQHRSVESEALTARMEGATAPRITSPRIT
jgi:hypothetical protein